MMFIVSHYSNDVGNPLEAVKTILSHRKCQNLNFSQGATGMIFRIKIGWNTVVCRNHNRKCRNQLGKEGLVNFPWASLLGCKSKIRPQGLWLCALPHRPSDGDPSRRPFQEAQLRWRHPKAQSHNCGALGRCAGYCFCLTDLPPGSKLAESLLSVCWGVRKGHHT